jgi:hypothetical protein
LLAQHFAVMSGGYRPSHHHVRRDQSTSESMALLKISNSRLNGLADASEPAPSSGMTWTMTQSVEGGVKMSAAGVAAEQQREQGKQPREGLQCGAWNGLGQVVKEQKAQRLCR